MCTPLYCHMSGRNHVQHPSRLPVYRAAFATRTQSPHRTVTRAQAAVGKFDGKHPSLTCATTAGKIFFHSPHEKDAQNQVRFLNINRKISALACGPLDATHDREQLLVGAQTTLLAYDVLENRDLFFKDAVRYYPHHAGRSAPQDPRANPCRPSHPAERSRA